MTYDKPTEGRRIQAGDCACCKAGGDLSVLDGQLREVIAEHGWAVVGVTSDRNPFAYTVGLTARGLPELYTEVPVPMMLGGATGVLNELAARQVGGVDLLAGPVEAARRQWSVVEMTDHAPLAMARRAYGTVRGLHARRA